MHFGIMNGIFCPFSLRSVGQHLILCSACSFLPLFFPQTRRKAPCSGQALDLHLLQACLPEDEVGSDAILTGVGVSMCMARAYEMKGRWDAYR